VHYVNTIAQAYKRFPPPHRPDLFDPIDRECVNELRPKRFFCRVKFTFPDYQLATRKGECGRHVIQMGMCQNHHVNLVWTDTVRSQSSPDDPLKSDVEIPRIDNDCLLAADENRTANRQEAEIAVEYDIAFWVDSQ